MKKIMHHAITKMGIFDYILFGQANKAYAYSLLSKGIQHHCSRSFFYKCLATRSTALLEDKEDYLKSAERYYDKVSSMSDPCIGAPRLCAQLFMKYLENHSDTTIRQIAGFDITKNRNTY